jgi:hypothetical protein
VNDEDKFLPSAERLRKFERVLRILFLAWTAVLVIESATLAYAGPATLVQELLNWPTHVRVAFVAGCAGALIPFTRFRSVAAVRVAALVAVCGAVAWIGSLLTLLAVLMLVMRNFD